MDSTKKRIILFIIVPLVVLIVFIFVLFFLFRDKGTQKTNTQTQQTLEIKTFSANGGVPLKTSKAFTTQGWNQVPDLEVLQEVTSRATGGEIANIKFVKFNKNYYAKVGIYTDTEIIYFYYIDTDRVWVQAEESEVPKEALDKIK